VRIARAVFAAVVVFTLLPSQGIAHHREGPCDMHREDDETVKQFSARQIRCAVDTFGPVRGGSERAICIAKRESGLLPDAKSPTGMYLGLYQHASEDWDRRYDEYTRASWDLPTSALKGRTNAIVAVRMVVAAGGWGEAGWPRGDC
jgi:hypothetical protein